ncbi:MAG: hypothetical protein ACXADS_10500 [Candidatus Thorarchaeota archaeon]|jgi:hypothetical protein
MSGARKAVDSTLRRILIYAAEIVMSIVLLIILCLPLVFSLPMWLQTVLLGVPKSDVLLNAVILFGEIGALVVTLALSGLSVLVGYLYLSRLSPKTTSDEEEEEVEEEDEEDYEAKEEEED